MKRKSVFIVAGSPSSPAVFNSGIDLDSSSSEESLIDELKRKRNVVVPLMDDAENRQFRPTEQERNSTAIKKWLVDLKHTMYDADLLLDQIKTEERNKDLCEKLKCSFPHTLSNNQETYKARIIEITEKLVDAVENGKTMGLKNRDGRGAAAAEERITGPSLDEAVVYGRNKEKEQILEWLKLPESAAHGVGVIAIVGMGGLGKTTLAQYVYNHVDVASDFTRSWACVSRNFNAVRVTGSILETLTNRPPAAFSTLFGLQNELKKELSGKKFLIVLDDVWIKSRSKWQQLIHPFSSGAQGSKIIIVTTQDHSVASVLSICHRWIASAWHRCELKPMSDEEGWSLLSKDVFGEEVSSQYPELQMIAKDIVIKCGGLPLAITTLGGLLRSDRDERVWRTIRESCIWQLGPEGQNDIVPALSLSYSYLPSHLKKCFAYCALFPKAYDFSEEELVNMWIDEGFVQQPNNGKSVEDFARDYFKDLLSRSFFTQPYRNVDVYVMHDVMHDLAQLLSADFHLQLDGDTTEKDCKKVRHVSYHSIDCNAPINDKGLSQITTLQTFLAHKTHPSWHLDEKILHKLIQQPFLRVLCLRGSKISRLPETIGGLKLLRCLDVSYTDVVGLPNSLYKLHSLGRLLCDGCDRIEGLFDDEMSGLDSLRRFTLSGKHLQIAPIYLYQLRKCSVRLVFCLPLQPADADMAQADASDSGDSLGGQVDVTMVDQADEPDCGRILLHVKVDIDKSHFSYDVQDFDLFAYADHSNLLGSLRPHEDLEQVSIKYFKGTRFPDWLADKTYRRIHSIKLSHCRLSSSSMPALGQLPSLKKLQLCDVTNAAMGTELSNSNHPFGALEELYIEDMNEWEYWEQSDVADGRISFFPRLNKLHLLNCPRLKGSLPADLPSLEDLAIYGCNVLVNSCLRDNRFLMFSSLQKLVLDGCDFVGNFPTEGSLPNFLTSLHIKSFTKLKRLDATGLRGLKNLIIDDCRELDGIDLQCLNSLKVLMISNCSTLEELSVEGLLRSLEELQLHRVHPKLNERCQRETGPYWPWISHVRNIRID